MLCWRQTRNWRFCLHKLCKLFLSFKRNKIWDLELLAQNLRSRYYFSLYQGQCWNARIWSTGMNTSTDALLARKVHDSDCRIAEPNRDSVKLPLYFFVKPGRCDILQNSYISFANNVVQARSMWSTFHSQYTMSCTYWREQLNPHLSLRNKTLPRSWRQN